MKLGKIAGWVAGGITTYSIGMASMFPLAAALGSKGLGFTGLAKLAASIGSWGINGTLLGGAVGTANAALTSVSGVVAGVPALMGFGAASAATIAITGLLTFGIALAAIALLPTIFNTAGDLIDYAVAGTRSKIEKAGANVKEAVLDTPSQPAMSKARDLDQPHLPALDAPYHPADAAIKRNHSHGETYLQNQQKKEATTNLAVG